MQAVVMHETGEPDVMRYEETDRVPLADVKRARGLSESGHVCGKLVLTVTT